MVDIPALIKQSNGFEHFNPMQQLVLNAPWESKNLVVASPTASGKTIIAELTGLNSILNRGKKAIYTCPLRALANEHYTDLQKKYTEKQNIRMAVATGDMDSSSKYLSQYDFIFTTYEKLNSLLVHRAEWLQQLGTLIIDEVHELDSDRGPTLEMIITKLRILNPKLQIIALSATIPNSDELATWLNAELIQSNYRPVPLKEGVHYEGVIEFHDRSKEKTREDDPIEAMLANTMEKKKQALVFANTRPRAESLAKQSAAVVQKFLSSEDKKELFKIATKIENALESPTEQCKKLSALVQNGVAFHHAGLIQIQRTAIEDGFRAGAIKTIAATPTLCITPDTLVWTGKKEIRAEELTLNKKILALKGNSIVKVNVEDIIKIPNERNIITVHTTSGRRIQVTENHRLLVKRNKKKFTIPAGECQIGDRIATVRKLPPPKGKTLKMEDFSPLSPYKNLALQPSDFYAIGAILGDGYSGAETQNGTLLYKGEPCIVGRDPEIFDHILSFCQKYKLHTRQTTNMDGVPCIFFGKNKWAREFWVRCGVEKGENKYIANKLLDADLPSIRALLQGVFDTDGFVTRDKGVGFSNISLELVKNVQKALLFFGVVSRLRERAASEMRIKNKTYKTKKSYEIVIEQKKSLLDFREKIEFSLTRKKKALDTLCSKLEHVVNYSSCKKCDYELHHNLFTGRTKEQKEWGSQKRQIIQQLGNRGPLTSAELQKKLGFIPYKGEKRLDHHFSLISRTKQGNSKVWQLNSLGTVIFQQVIQKNEDLDDVISEKCPICHGKLGKKIRDNWRKDDFEEDIFWDFINNIELEGPEKHPYVYDVVLPSNGSNDHYFVAEGIFVHNSAGVNLPSFRVIITSLHRFDFGGMVSIPIREYRQMAGRAGRPRYDTAGESIVLCKNELEAQAVMEEYIHGEMEPVSSQVGREPILRMHLLGLIASRFIFDTQSMDDFFSKTLYAFQYKNTDNLFRMLRGLVKELSELGFIEGEENRFWTTKIGSRVAELYLDPLSAADLISALKRMQLSHFGALFALVDTTEARPFLKVKAKDEALVWEELQSRWSEIPVDSSEAMFTDMQLAQKFQTAKFLDAWTNETPEQQLLEEFNIQPGIIRAKLQIVDWLAYAAVELAPLVGAQHHTGLLSRMRKRLSSGIKEELVLLCELRGIGRVRARRMYNAGIKTVADVKVVSVEQLAKIIGTAVAITVKKQLGTEIEKGAKKKIEAALKEQKTLFD